MARPPEFSEATKRTLRDQVGGMCARATCRALTVAAGEGRADKVVVTGEAAHIRGAKPGSARYDPTMDDAARAAIGNGLWLCVRCHRLVDRDEAGYTREELERWKAEAVATAREAQRQGRALAERAPVFPIHWAHGTTEDDTYVPRHQVLAALDRHVADLAARTVTAHGIAGTGKTSLIGHWLKVGQATTTGRFEQALFWSFYSDRDVDALARRLLELIDRDGKPAGDDAEPLARFERVARHVAPQLVVLDGVEVLQHRLDEGFDYGRFVDTRLQDLLDEIARLSKPWLVVCTSRFPLTDRLTLATDRHLELGALEHDEALEVLGHNGVRGPLAERTRVIDAFQGHALALKLFAIALPRAERGEPKAHLDRLLGRLPFDAPLNEKVARLVAFYSESLEPLQRLLLQTLSIFRSPVPLPTIEKVAVGLAPWVGLDAESVTHVAAELGRLRSSGIVIHDTVNASAYSCHPVVLDAFRRELLGQQAGRAAIDLLTGRPDDVLLEGVSELEPLILALEALIEAGDTRTARQIYETRFESGRAFVRQGLPFEAVRVFDAFLREAAMPAPAGSRGRARQHDAERKFLIPAASFDIELGELRSAERRLQRALEVHDQRAHPDIYRNLARVDTFAGTSPRQHGQRSGERARARRGRP